ncbi:MAG: hypothetical protein WAW37_06680 [Syntrophobacteraceae bacterium]
MKKVLATIVAAGLLLLPLSLTAFADGPSDSSSPPIAQPLVREGDFAVSLAQALKLTNSDDEVQAENILASSGIAPSNGWIADYPVTPDIFADLRDSVQRAAAAGRLGIPADAAVQIVQNVSTDMGLAIAVAGDRVDYSSAAGSYTDCDGQPSDTPPPPCPSPEVVDNYYYDTGPPVVTYYAPPWDYAYLYSWVPWPFWWGGFGFGGYFILNDFHVRSHGFHHGHHGHHGHHRSHVSNHVRDGHGRFSRVQPRHGATRADRRSSGSRMAGGRDGARSIMNRGAGRSAQNGGRNALAGAGSRTGRNMASNRASGGNRLAGGNTGGSSSNRSFGNRPTANRGAGRSNFSGMNSGRSGSNRFTSNRSTSGRGSGGSGFSGQRTSRSAPSSGFRGGSSGFRGGSSGFRGGSSGFRSGGGGGGGGGFRGGGGGGGGRGGGGGGGRGGGGRGR